MKPVEISHAELSGLIGLIYESALEDPQWKRFLDRMAQLFPATSAMVLGHQGNRLFPAYTGTGVRHERFERAGIEVDFVNRRNENALTSNAKMPNGFVGRTRKLADHEVFFSSNFHRTLMAPMGQGHFMTLKLDSHSDRGAFIVFSVSADPEVEAATHDPLFETLKLLAPHAVRALKMARALSMARNALSVMGGFLDTIVLPMVVVTGRTEFVFANAAGRRLLAREVPMRVAGDGRLQMQDAQDARAFAAKLREMEGQPVAAGLRVEGEDGPLSLCLTPFRPSLSDVSPLDRDLLQEERLFAVFIGQRGGDAINLGLLRDVYELTAREAEVCGALLAGQSPAQIADGSGRALKTVRNQIQAVYEKVGVTSVAELSEALSVFRTVGAVFDGGAGPPQLTGGGRHAG
ncbi:helix-turn-helix transcriptional regulator [Roseovarius sp. 217]|uniref:helix-turn-helix transcriptional regulator n=1 Tax=Roseovarius sp. (strain 217) TaxID=314264 RepID=UPI0000684FA5|nr:helix-turn-helix transcriptional regulator [Roseovarius sp. 217]EAQ23730.1 transcriptional regulator, LuxR family protein [Roseovarius sp. 217]